MVLQPAVAQFFPCSYLAPGVVVICYLSVLMATTLVRVEPTLHPLTYLGGEEGNPSSDIVHPLIPLLKIWEGHMEGTVLLIRVHNHVAWPIFWPLRI